MSQKFPLFRLLHVPLYEVLELIEPKTILTLSFCSKKTRYIVKNYCGPSKKLDIHFEVNQRCLRTGPERFQDDLIAVMDVSPLPWDFDRVPIGPYNAPIILRMGVVYILWKNPVEMMGYIIKYATGIFNRQIHSLSISYVVDFEVLKIWTKWIRKFQRKIYGVSLHCDGEDANKKVRHLLNSDVVSGDLALSAPDLSGFKAPPPRRYSIDYLSLNTSNWVTLDHLLAMDVKLIVLEGSSLTCREINIFLKKWINGECSKWIKVLNVGMENVLNYDVLMEGIEVNRRDPNLRRDYATSYNSAETIFGGLDIKRKEDGAMATIVKQPQGKGVTVVFWPDYKGNPYH